MVIALDSIVGLSTPYGITKSTCVHFITPIGLIIFYFISIEEYVSEKDYAKNGFYTMIIIACYLTYVIIRYVMIVSFDPTMQDTNTSNDWFMPFPYPQINPAVTPAWLMVMAGIAVLFLPYGMGNLFNYLSNLSARSLVLKVKEKESLSFWTYEKHWEQYLENKN
jgi:hypothetical protein